MPRLISIAEAKAHLGDTTDVTDAALGEMIEVASQTVEDFCQRPFGRSEEVETLFGTGSATIFPKRTPLAFVSSCEVMGDPVPVTWDSIGVTTRTGFPFARNARITLRYTGGDEPVPGAVRMATRIVLQAQRTAPALDPNLSGEQLAGVYGGSYSEFGPGALPRAARHLLNAHIRRY